SHIRGPRRWHRHRRGARGCGSGRSAQPELRRARRPLAPARPRLQDLGALGLLGGAGLRRQPGAADRLPGRQRELVQAVVTVAGVRGRVAAGLALRERGPHVTRDGATAATAAAGAAGAAGAAARGRGPRRGGRALRGAVLDDAVLGLTGHLDADELAGGHLAVHGVLEVGVGACTLATLVDDAALALVEVVGTALDGLERQRLGAGGLLARDAGDGHHRLAVGPGRHGHGVVLADLDLGAQQRGAEVRDAVDLERAALAVDDEGDRAVRDQRHVESEAALAARRRHHGLAAARGDLGEGLGGGVADRPDDGRATVDLDLDLLGGAHDDLGAVGEGLVDAGHHEVVLADLDALGGEHAADAAGEGADVDGAAVEVDLDVLVGGAGGDRAAERERGGGRDGGCGPGRGGRASGRRPVLLLGRLGLGGRVDDLGRVGGGLLDGGWVDDGGLVLARVRCVHVWGPGDHARLPGDGLAAV